MPVERTTMGTGLLNADGSFGAVDNGTISGGEPTPEVVAGVPEVNGEVKEEVIQKPDAQTGADQEATEKSADDPSKIAGDNSGAKDVLDAGITKSFTSLRKQAESEARRAEEATKRAEAAERALEEARSTQSVKSEVTGVPDLANVNLNDYLESLPSDYAEDGSENVWWQGAWYNKEQLAPYLQQQQAFAKQEAKIMELSSQVEQLKQMPEQAAEAVKTAELSNEFANKLSQARAEAMPTLDPEQASEMDVLLAQKVVALVEADTAAGKEFSPDQLTTYYATAIQSYKRLMGALGNAQIAENVKLAGATVPNNQGQIVLEGQTKIEDLSKEDRRTWLERNAERVLNRGN